MISPQLLKGMLISPLGAEHNSEGLPLGNFDRLHGIAASQTDSVSISFASALAAFGEGRMR
jgi:hypothetical protein